MKDITCIGELLIDLTQTGISESGVPLFAANPGGAPANVAVAASRPGASTAFIGKTGRDQFGAYLRRVLEENHVDCAGLHTASQPTTMAVVPVDSTGERSSRHQRKGGRHQRCGRYIPGGGTQPSELPGGQASGGADRSRAENHSGLCQPGRRLHLFPQRSDSGHAHAV